MRLYCVILLGSLLSSGHALASSFVALPASDAMDSPSIVFLGQPAPAAVAAAPAEPATFTDAAFGVALHYPAAPPPALAPRPAAPAIVSPSIVAMGEPAEPPVEDMRVAAIPSKPAGRPAAMPMVIRQGLIGEAFSRGPSSPAPIAAPAPQQVSAPSPAPKDKPPQRRREEQPAAPPPPPPPSAPSGPKPFLRGVE